MKRISNCLSPSACLLFFCRPSRRKVARNKAKNGESNKVGSETWADDTDGTEASDVDPNLGEVEDEPLPDLDAQTRLEEGEASTFI